MLSLSTAFKVDHPRLDSAAALDAYRQDLAARQDPDQTVIVVCHGVTLRAFIMSWLRLTPEWFEAEQNPGNCSIRLLSENEDHGYIYKGKSDASFC